MYPTDSAPPSDYSATLLVELLTEELPPKTLASLAQAFAKGLVTHLDAQDLIDGPPPPVFESYATPRRLAVTINKVRRVAPTKTRREKILPVAVAIDQNGQPTPTLAKKLNALGLRDLTIADFERAMDGKDGKNEAFFVNRTVPGIPLTEGLQAALDQTLTQLPIAKMMRYQRSDYTAVQLQFVRPAHRLVALHGAGVISVNALGLSATRTTLGHRFLSTAAIDIPHAQAYATQLRDLGHVIASYTARRELICAQLTEHARNEHVIMPDPLLDEVTGLVEWPTVYRCRFDETFLSIPQACLILTMQTHQKYFALTDTNGKLCPSFLVVSNIDTLTPVEIIRGNERVLHARLSDAKFFFEQDKKKRLAERVPQLAQIIYHHKLGSQRQRVARIEAIASQIAAWIGTDTVLTSRAAMLSKADLTTEMVSEFPELQGTMGMHYARIDGEPEAVAIACAEHYQPRFSGDALPSTDIGLSVALADKLETLVGIWGIGLIPTGEKDPFALRRHALGLLRILLEKALPLELARLLSISFASFFSSFAALPLPQITDPTQALLRFIKDRLHGLLREKGYHAHEINAVISDHLPKFDQLIARLAAVRALTALPEAQALAAANKRISNILKKTTDAIPAKVQPLLLIESAEKALYTQLESITPVVKSHVAARRYTDALLMLAHLRAAVDDFFNHVMVNAEDAALRANRLALLTQLQAQMNCIADISKLSL